LGLNHAKSDDKVQSCPEEEVSFLFSCNYCVLFVDIIDSTRTMARIRDTNRIRQYYLEFFGGLSPIARRFNGRIIKIAGDCLICYFPRTSEQANKSAFKDVLDCGNAMITAHKEINLELKSMNLPHLEYRISADYGRMEIAKSTTSLTEDLFGSTMNLCAKINHMATQKEMVIGGDLYQVIKHFSFDKYSFADIGGYDIGLKQFYPVYSVVAKEESVVDRPCLVSQRPISGQGSKLEILRRLHLSRKGNRHVAAVSASDCIRPPVNIMIVDDEPDMLLTFKEFLKFEGHRAELFTDSQEALTRYKEVNRSYYDLIILDIRMPGMMNGLQLYQRLRDINANINVLFISALDAADEVCSIFSGILPHNVLRKPVLREQFIQRVKLCLARTG
jgi:two-component system response regulator ChvI